MLPANHQENMRRTGNVYGIDQNTGKHWSMGLGLAKPPSGQVGLEGGRLPGPPLSSGFSNVTPERMQKAEEERRRYLERNNGVDKHNLADDIYNFMATQPGDTGHVTASLPGRPMMKPIQVGRMARPPQGIMAPPTRLGGMENLSGSLGGQIRPSPYSAPQMPQMGGGFGGGFGGRFGGGMMPSGAGITPRPSPRPYQGPLLPVPPSEMPPMGGGMINNQDLGAQERAIQERARLGLSQPMDERGLRYPHAIPPMSGGMSDPGQITADGPVRGGQGMQQFMQFMQTMMQMFQQFQGGGGRGMGGGFQGPSPFMPQQQQYGQYQPQRMSNQFNSNNAFGGY
jgi:hypothetical protein